MPAHNCPASVTRVGSARLCTCTTAAPARRVSSSSASSKRRKEDRSSRSEIPTPVSDPAATCAAQSLIPGTCCGSRAANGRPAATAAAGVRGRPSATASRKARTSASGSGSWSGRRPARGVAYPSCGSAAATARRWSMSAASSGPARQASTPSGVSPGSSRPRAARVSACRAAVPQARVAGCAAGLRGACASRGRAEATEKVTAGTVRLRTPSPCGRTTVSGPCLPVSGRASPSGAQKATRPSRGTAAGRKTAAWRSSAAGVRLRCHRVPLPFGSHRYLLVPVGVTLCRRV